MTERLHAFAKAVVARQEKQARDVDEETRRAIALELGMTEEDLLAAAAETEAQKARAKILRRSGLLDDAINSLEAAHAFAPSDLEASFLLADALVARGRKLDDADSLARARDLCLSILEAAPGHTEASSLLRVIHNNPAGQHKRVPIFVVFLVGVALAVALATLSLLVR
jgi:hypothetical protein